MGRCGSDCIRRGSEARPVAIFSLATHNHFKNQDSGESLIWTLNNGLDLIDFDLTSN